MLDYLVGPFLALLPKSVRKLLPFSDSINWGRATFVSGFAEFAIALAAFINWYFVSMSTWVNRGVEAAATGKAGPGVTDHAISAMALLMWSNHPLTWILGYFTAEGVVRFCGAAFSGNLLGTLPLFLVDKFVRLFFESPNKAREVPDSSFIDALGDKVLGATQPAYVDEMVSATDGNDEILEIRASRKKPDWDPPRVVRMQERYYRLEACSKGSPPRPFRYRLRRLSAGVPGRNVLLYEATNVFVTQKP